ncbi:DNA primase [Roseibium aggregatum]|jgi:DNA primase|uniref:DNA primase n=1 Tax=Roseibium aggregatum TaxID=187304 RepID=A0A0M6Y1H0_9HYPH|nr:DNA primase [Roseibium aggregatum]UFI02934.1 DNA primase [Roseibium aggregatum]CTQ43534.1 DNA primase [Roseibium aggregatum]
MRFEPRLLDEIRARLTLSDVVGRRVTWDRRKTQPGKGDYWACCPFHQEKSPSFHVDDRRNRYKCFGCGASGDHFTFLCETEGLSFPEAVERLAEQSGVGLPAPDPQAARREKKRAGLADICEMAAQFFQAEFAGPRGDTARAYTQKRGLTPDTLREFRFGFAPESRDALKGYLAAREIPEAAMIEAGLIIKPEDGRPSYDRFRGRLMIPIQDDRGRVVAFGGRTLSPDGQPKYLNSPETPLFHKGVMLFNAHRAREPAFKSGEAVVVEGYLDAIALWQAGIHHVVASLGTAFTEDQVVRLWKFAPEPVICFDGDAAGVSAAHRAIDRIFPVLKSGYSFQFCFLPDGMDPDDLIKQRGVAGFHDEVERAQSLFDVVWEREISVSRLDTPERKAALEKRFDDLIATIRDERVRRRYQLDLKFKLSNLFFEQARQSRQGGKGGKGGGSADAASPLGTARERVAASHDFGTERLVLGLSMRFPHLLDRNFERFSRLPFANDLHRQLRDILCRIVDDLEATPISDLTSAFEEPLRNIMGEMMLETIGMQQQRGAEFSALIHRFPLLKSNPPEDFIEAAYLHFLDVLELNALEDELSSELATADEQLDENSWMRIQALTQDLSRRREECARDEADLAERAKKIRTAPPVAVAAH